jgi:predicted nucleic acid-binding protein
MALLDTNVLIDLRPTAAKRKRAEASAAVLDRVRRGEMICTSRINEAELRVGPPRAPDPAGELAAVEEVLSSCVIIEFDADAARRFGEVKAHLLAIGRPVGDADIQIAAVALACGETLLTRNVRHFVDVPNLLIESY